MTPLRSITLLLLVAFTLAACGTDDNAEPGTDGSSRADTIADLATPDESAPADTRSVDDGVQHPEDAGLDDTAKPPEDGAADQRQPTELKPLTSLMLANPGAIARVREPVSRGIPLAVEAQVLSADKLHLLDADGTIVPAGFSVVARWGGTTDDATRPIKWVLVDFLADIGSQQEKEFTVAFGDGAKPEPTVTVEQGPGMVVSTGECVFTVGAADGGFLPLAECGGESFFAPPFAGDFELAGKDGAVLHSRDFPPESVAIYRQTPVSATVEVKGKLGVQQDWKRPLSYTAYLTFFGQTGLVNVLFRLENRNKAIHPGNVWLLGSDGSIFFEDLTLHLPFATGEQVGFDVLEEGLAWASGEAKKVKLYQDSSGGPNWNSLNHMNHAGLVRVSFKGYKRYVDTVASSTGDRADGTMVISYGNRAIGATVKHFWQNFPKALRFSNSALQVSLFPTEFDDLFELQGGEYKTHEMVLGFATGDDSAEQLKGTLASVHQPLVVRNSAKYYTDTGAMLYDLAPRKTFVQDTWEETLNAVVVPTGSNPRTMITQRETIDEYGWRNFGENMADHETDCGSGGYSVPISHDNNQYDGTSLGFIHFARIDDMPVWYTFGEECARHFLDIDVYHTEDGVEVYNGGTFPHTTHDVNAGRSTHRTYPEAAITQGCTQYDSGGPAPDYIHLDGVVLYHLFSGYPFVLDTVREIADWAVVRTGGKYTALAASFRPFANCIRTMFTAYRLFHDEKYLTEAKNLIAEVQVMVDKFDGKTWSGAMVGKALGRYLDFQAEYGMQDESSQMALDALLALADKVLDVYGKSDVQAYRFSEMLLYAYKYAPNGHPNRDQYKQRGYEIHEAAAEANWAKGTYSSQKEMTVMGTNGNLYYYFKALE